MLKAVALTDVGRVRMINEDRAIVQEQGNKFALAVLADGMGGHQAGDIASQMAVDIIHEQLQLISPDTPVEERKSHLKAAIELANGKIFEFASQGESYQGMGTTIVAAVADEQTIVMGHVGDSRIYRIHPGGIEQMTEDHSLVNVLVSKGQITLEEASHHPRRNVLTRALGTELTIEVDIEIEAWNQGDILLLCSDGLSGLVSAEQIWALIHRPGSLEEKAKLLINEALTAGGDDNVTVVLVSNEWNTHSSEEDVDKDER